MSMDSTHEVAACQACGRIAFERRHCRLCADDRQPRVLLCSDCVTVCPDCGRVVCESHMGRTACTACNGPSDDELPRDGGSVGESYDAASAQHREMR